MLGGVAVALAGRLGRPPTVVRLVMVLVALVSGVGAALYVLAWLVVPAEGESESIASRAMRDRRGLGLVAALLPVFVAVLVIVSTLRLGWLSSAAWPLCLAGAGMVMIWRNGSEEERRLLRRATGPLVGAGAAAGERTRRALAGRIAAGALLAAAGVAILTRGPNASTLRPMAGVALVLGSIVVLFGPWWLNVGRELMLERQARVRAEEHAEMAARVHDSVLQTLALIQRSAGDPQRVAQLARAQERELRSWLFEGRPPGSSGPDAHTVAEEVRRIQSEVESLHGVAVEVVTVGDAPLSGPATAILAAAREAATNAATWSGAPVVAIFAEVEEEAVSVFVRDRGRGFDRTDVAPGRQGVAESIEGRMRRAGGTAVIRTAPGQGTEVELRLPLGAPGPTRAAEG